jgi:hypothetical protein
MVSVMKHPPERDWMIVAPWWQWTDPAAVPDLHAGRLSRPVFQKYDSPKLVNDFLADPQRCLKFVDDDLVHARRPALPIPLGSNKKPRRLSEEIYVPDGTNTRKIFLDTHKRFYLVVCEMHCDGPGFPKVARNKVCEAGFVIRRRTATVPSCGMDEVKPILKSLQTGRARLGRVNQLAEIESIASAAAAGKDAAPSSPKLLSLLKTRASLQALVASEKARLDDWAHRLKVAAQLQGWFTSPQGFDKVGCWGPVDEMPTDLGLEASFPLYPLIPDKNDPEHAGHFGTVYFGVLPTSSHDCDRIGIPRFDDQEYYEVRCWVRRHLVPHDPDQPCPCPDQIFWSVPTRPYKLASHFDLTGTSHHPVTIQMPDLNDLAAQAKPSLGVRFAKPPGSLMISGDEKGKLKDDSRSSDTEICSFPIPLITIVASFVFELFLPVIVFLFQLWWMLALKFCIPLKVSVAAGITAEIALDASLSFEASLAVDAKVDYRNGTKEMLGAAAGQALIDNYSPIGVINVVADLKAACNPATGPSVTADLDFEAEVTHA